jgi:hypothetical protein
MEQRTLVPGLILIGLGVFLGIVQVTGVGAEAVVAVIGGAFLVTYALTRNYGFLVLGGIILLAQIRRGPPETPQPPSPPASQG